MLDVSIPFTNSPRDVTSLLLRYDNVSLLIELIETDPAMANPALAPIAPLPLPRGEMEEELVGALEVEGARDTAGEPLALPLPVGDTEALDVPPPPPPPSAVVAEGDAVPSAGVPVALAEALPPPSAGVALLDGSATDELRERVAGDDVEAEAALDDRRGERGAQRGVGGGMMQPQFLLHLRIVEMRVEPRLGRLADRLSPLPPGP